MNEKSFITLITGAKVIKLFTTVIYPRSIVILSFFVIKLYYPGNYHGMAVNNHSILTLEKVGSDVHH
jgi:hypothetical protein